MGKGRLSDADPNGENTEKPISKTRVHLGADKISLHISNIMETKPKQAEMLTHL
jgi:hypothetical protein